MEVEAGNWRQRKDRGNLKVDELINEFLVWEQEGMSCFEQELKKLTQNATKPTQSILDLFCPRGQAA